MRQARPYLLTLSILLLYPLAASAGAERGELLYENHCTGCHVSTLHVREQRKSKTPAAMRALILRWSVEQKLGWSEDELADVYQYLNSRYYKFPVKTPAR